LAEVVGLVNAMKAVPSFMRSSSIVVPARPRPAGIPQAFLLRDLKEKRKLRLLSRKLLAFITFVCIYLAALLMDRNISGRTCNVLHMQVGSIVLISCLSLGYVVQRIVETELLMTAQGSSSVVFNSIASASDFWEWFMNSFLTIMYSGSGGIQAYTLASHTVILGGFHLVQTRYGALNFSDPVNKGSSCYSDTPVLQNRTCYSAKQESVEDFGVSNGSDASKAELRSLDMFSYSTDNESDISGFQTFFLRSKTNGAEEFARAELMHQYSWIDRQTKDVAITMALCNPNLRILSIVHLTIEFNLAGGVIPSSDILVLNLEPYDFNVRKNILRAILEAIFVGHVIYFAMLEVWDVSVLSGGDFRVVRLGVVCRLAGTAD
jgi:hypothetical protein